MRCPPAFLLNLSADKAGSISEYPEDDFDTVSKCLGEMVISEERCSDGAEREQEPSIYSHSEVEWLRAHLLTKFESWTIFD